MPRLVITLIANLARTLWRHGNGGARCVISAGFLPDMSAVAVRERSASHARRIPRSLSAPLMPPLDTTRGVRFVEGCRVARRAPRLYAKRAVVRKYWFEIRHC